MGERFFVYSVAVWICMTNLAFIDVGGKWLKVMGYLIVICINHEKFYHYIGSIA